MVNIKQAYECGVCGNIYLNIKEAEKCENQEVIDPFNIRDVFKFKCRSDLFPDFYLSEGILKIINKLGLTDKHARKYSVAAICYNSPFEDVQRKCVFIQKELIAEYHQSFGHDFNKLKKGQLEEILQQNPEVEKMWKERIEP